MSTLGPYINGNKFFDKFASIGGVMNGSNIHIATTNTTTDLQKQGLRQKKLYAQIILRFGKFKDLEKVHWRQKSLSIYKLVCSWAGTWRS